MDTFRGNFDGEHDPLGLADDIDAHEDDTGREDPPAAIGTDERRMQVRAYNHWASLLEDRSFPSIEDLTPQALPDFGPYSVLLDFSNGIDNPGVSYLGDELAQECGAQGSKIDRLNDVPARSLLSRITDHYMQILANQAPIGFEAEFVNQRDQTILYRGILLPFSSDDDTIDFIYGIINWKELADAATADELLLQIDQALGADDSTDGDVDDPTAAMPATTSLSDWADGPAADNAAAEASAEAEPDTDELGLPVPAYGANTDANLDYAPDSDFALGDLGDEEEFDEADEDDEDIDSDSTPSAESGGSFASLTEHMSGLGTARAKKTATEMGVVEGENAGATGSDAHSISDGDFDLSAYGLSDDDEESGDDGADDSSFGSLGALLGGDASLGDDIEDEDEWAHDSAADLPELPPLPALAQQAAAPEATPEPAMPADETATAEAVPPELELGDWLAAAREQAEAAKNREDRSRAALYEAVGRAYDFALAAQDAPDDFAELVEDSGLTMQERAPMTPVVKLVFGADYDKTRLTEYAAVLTFAKRERVEQGTLAEYLGAADGGLKAVVAAERAWRREQSGKPAAQKPKLAEALAQKLRDLPPQSLSALDTEGEEFALVMVRRMDDGSIAIAGEVPHDATLVTKAARSLLAE